MVEDSTKEYKQQQKEMGTKKTESKILGQAQKDLKKIENIKQQFRMQVQGGVFFN